MIMIAPQYLDLTLEEVLVRCYRAVHCNPGEEDYEIHPTSIFTPLRLDLPCRPHSAALVHNNNEDNVIGITLFLNQEISVSWN